MLFVVVSVSWLNNWRFVNIGRGNHFEEKGVSKAGGDVSLFDDVDEFGLLSLILLKV